MTQFETNNCRRFSVLAAARDNQMTSLLEETLDWEGYPYDICDSREEVFAVMAESHSPIVLIDEDAAGIDALNLCRSLRTRSAERYIYIILFSSPYRGREQLVAGLEAGADEYLLKPVTEAELRVRLRIACRILTLEQSLKKSLEELQHLSVRDPLTGLFNRRYLLEHLPQEIKRAYRYDRPLSLILFDLDHFKAINETYGHGVGDQVLQISAEKVHESIRSEIDWVVRYGGEEFLLVLPETEFGGAIVVAERLRASLAQAPILAGKARLEVTGSFGVATLPGFPKRERLALETLIECADRCLYEAKAAGRNRVEGITL